MTPRKQSSAATSTPPKRSPQTRRDNVVDLRLPGNAKRRRLTLANVSAVCEQLGEHVSTRNVQRILGGSLRDIGPLMKAWRENRDAAGDAARDAGGDQAQALGTILMAVLEEHGAAVTAAIEAQAVANAATQEALLERVERLLGGHSRALTKTARMRKDPATHHGESDGHKDLRVDLQAIRTDVARILAHGAEAAAAATGRDLADLGSRIDRLTRAVDQLQAERRVPAPDSVAATIASALSEALAGYEARLAPVVDQLGRLAGTVATAADKPAADPELATALSRIEASLAVLANPKPSTRPQPSKAILTRLDALLSASADLPAQLKAAVTPPKRKRKSTKTRSTRTTTTKEPTRRTAKATAPKKSTTPARKATARNAVKTVPRKTVNSKTQASARKRKIAAPQTARMSTSKMPTKRTVKAVAPKKLPTPARKAAAKKTIKTVPRKTVKKSASASHRAATRSPRGSNTSRRKKTNALAVRTKQTAKPRKAPTAKKSTLRNRTSRLKASSGVSARRPTQSTRSKNKQGKGDS
ncbi:hypothetical protein [uncultured Pseudoxanthomonas sp.]|uniref:hypothetical protein n=1 Tax=uncultured Pseudoxanthomonas sp. TaxID=281701 RepID=UPI002604E5C7|nr:hypothetical protein [uncultured Pseudoxanthomonas sp.]